MNLKRALNLEDPEVRERKASEKRRRLSYLKGKHQAIYRPKEVRPKSSRPSTIQTILGGAKKLSRGAKKLNVAMQKQAKKMPSDKTMEDFVWGKK